MPCPREPDEQLSLTDPDARSMTSHGKGTSVVGYNGRQPTTLSTT